VWPHVAVVARRVLLSSREAYEWYPLAASGHPSPNSSEWAVCRDERVCRRPHLGGRLVCPAERSRCSRLNGRLSPRTRDDKEDVQLVGTVAPSLVLEVPPDLGLEPMSSLRSAVDFDVGADGSFANGDLCRAIRRESGFAAFRVGGECFVLAEPAKSSTCRFRRGQQLDVEVIDGQRVVDVEKTASGSSRPKGQDLSVDPGDLRGDAGAFGSQDIGPRPGTGERLRQVDHVPNQSKLLELRERGLAPALAAEEESRQVVPRQGALLCERSQHLDVTLGKPMFEREKWRALACRFHVQRLLQPIVTSDADTPSDTLLAFYVKAPCPTTLLGAIHLSKGAHFRRFRRTSFCFGSHALTPLKGGFTAGSLARDFPARPHPLYGFSLLFQRSAESRRMRCRTTQRAGFQVGFGIFVKKGRSGRRRRRGPNLSAERQATVRRRQGTVQGPDRIVRVR
jgi:hypothetical protein